MNYTRAVLAALAFLVLAALAPAFSGDVRPPAATHRPENTSRTTPGIDIKSRPVCNVTKDRTRQDFESHNKEHPGSIGSRIEINPDPRFKTENNDRVSDVLCTNRLAFASIKTGLFGLKSGKPRSVSDSEWRDPRHGAKWLIEEAWLPNESRFECGVVDPPGRKTVFALNDGELKLGITSVKPGRRSCYAILMFRINDRTHRVLARLDCRLQIVTIGDLWGQTLSA
jgi:hypothetical protein